MAKFLSYDGVDKNGVRAEVMVQTGTGRIKNISGRGKANPDGSYRNVEVEFDPDNPKLQHKVYALLDTTSNELWDYVQEAHLSQRDISYRIESQRRRNVDRTLKFEDLKHSEQAVRVLAAVDKVFSHEALTSPAEDPESGAPSALNNAPAAPANHSTGPNLLDALATARTQGVPDSIIDALAAYALANGHSPESVLSAGFDASEDGIVTRVTPAGARAVEEKPWSAFNTDGRINAGSYAVAHAATAERFALDHLVGLYSAGKKTNVSVNDEMISQAASLAVEILSIADAAQHRVVGRTDRQKNSYNRGLSLVLDAIEKRHPAPIGGDSQIIETWSSTVQAEAQERFIGVLMVAEGRRPSVEDLHAWDVVAAQDVQAAMNATPEEPAVDNSVADNSEPTPESVLMESLGAVAVKEATAQASFVAPTGLPVEGDSDFVAPSAEDIEQLRNLCMDAGIVGDPKAISDWLEHNLGVRSARKSHATALQAFLTFYKDAGPDRVRADVMKQESSAA